MSLANKEKYGKRYSVGGCTKTQLKELVVLDALTSDEYKDITGEDYTTE